MQSLPKQKVSDKAGEHCAEVKQGASSDPGVGGSRNPESLEGVEENRRWDNGRGEAPGVRRTRVASNRELIVIAGEPLPLIKLAAEDQGTPLLCIDPEPQQFRAKAKHGDGRALVDGEATAVRPIFERWPDLGEPQYP